MLTMGARKAETMNVAEVFDRPVGSITLNPSGKWWVNRQTLGIDPIVETVCVQIADGTHVCEIEGTPDQLMRLCGSIVAQVTSAIVNTEA